MSRTIWNEGRVVGLSAYELYVRHTLSEFPDEPVMTEKEWLASTLGDGVSLILKLGAGTAKGVHTFQIPSASLCAATGAITASLFNGTAQVNSQGWGTKVTSYGPLLQDASGKYITDVSQLDEWDKENLHVIRDFLKIVDGVVFHDNTKDSTSEYEPNLTSTTATLRLRLSASLTKDVYVLLTGFMHKSIVQGLYKVDSNPLSSPKPENGDFLGPEVYPWGTKVIFSVHSEVYELISRYSYQRELPDGGDSLHVEAKAIIDFESVDPVESYANVSDKGESMVNVDVKDINSVDDKGTNVLATYQKDSEKRYPAALYGGRVRQIGLQQLAPIDIVSPGSVKVFEDKDLAMNYPLVYPNLYSFYMDVENEDIYLIDKEIADSGSLPAPIGPKIETINAGTQDSPKFIARTYKGSTDEPTEEIKAISMYDTSGKLLSTDGTKGDIITKDKLDWTTLLQALGTDKVIDLLGEALRYIRKNNLFNLSGTGENKLAGSLKVEKSIAATGDISSQGNVSATGNIVATGSVTANGGTYNGNTDDAEFKFNKPIKSGDNYIVLSNGLRLYISSSAPATTGVPIGSIGIGWTE